jgi:hypothetical protein
MNVVQQTFTILILQEHPVGIWMISAFTASLGLFIFIAFDSPVDFFGFFCIACANCMMFGSPVKTFIFDKNINLMTVKQKGWLGTQVRSYSIDNITGIQIEKKTLLAAHFYRIRFTLRSGKRFYLTNVYSSDLKLQLKMANYIKSFLKANIIEDLAK